MASYMEPIKLESFLVHVLTPVYRLTEDDTVRDSQMGTSLARSNYFSFLNPVFRRRGIENDGGGVTRPHPRQSWCHEVLVRLSPDQAGGIGG